MELFNNFDSTKGIQLGKEDFTELAFKREIRKGNEILLILKQAQFGQVNVNLPTITLESKSNLRTEENQFHAKLDFEYNEYSHLEEQGEIIYLQNIKLIRINTSFSKDYILAAFVLPYAQK